MTPLASRHATFARKFGDHVRAITDPNGPTPVPEWTVGDIVDHLLTWPVPIFSQWFDLELTQGTEGPLAARWDSRSQEISSFLDDAMASAVIVDRGPMAGNSAGEVVDRIYTSDIFMHTWDLARAIGSEPDMDENFAHELLEGMKPIASVLRESGQYGPPVATDSPDPVLQLAAFIGRDPGWTRRG